MTANIAANRLNVGATRQRRPAAKDELNGRGTRTAAVTLTACPILAGEIPMRQLVAIAGLLAIAAAPFAARAAPVSPDGITQAIAGTQLAYAKYKSVKVRTGKVRRHGPPPWAPAHGYRRKFHRY